MDRSKASDKLAYILVYMAPVCMRADKASVFHKALGHRVVGILVLGSNPLSVAGKQEEVPSVLSPQRSL